MTSSSTGSTISPLMVFVTMSGRDTCISKPSRRIISIRIDSCSSPRPTTFICSGESVGSSRIDTLPSSSRSSRSLQLPRRHVLAFAAGHRRRVDAEDDRHRRLVDRDRRNRDLVLHVRDRLADRDVLDAGQAHDVAGGRFLDVDALQTIERVQLGDLRVLHGRDRACTTATGSPILTRPLKMRPMAMRPR